MVDEAFSAQQASSLTGCTHHQLRYWDRVGLVRPSVQGTGGRAGVRRLYSFRDLVWLRVVKGLLDNGMSVQRVRRAADYLRRNADLDETLAGVTLVTDGVSIFQVIEGQDELLDALKEGQMAMFVAIDEITQEVEEDISLFELDKARFLDILHRSEEDVASSF